MHTICYAHTITVYVRSHCCRTMYNGRLCASRKSPAESRENRQRTIALTVYAISILVLIFKDNRSRPFPVQRHFEQIKNAVLSACRRLKLPPPLLPIIIRKQRLSRRYPAPFSNACHLFGPNPFWFFAGFSSPPTARQSFSCKPIRPPCTAHRARLRSYCSLYHGDRVQNEFKIKNNVVF